MKSRILVKVGTNVLTRSNGRLNYNIISDLVEQIVALQKDHEVILVSSGAAGAGREFFDFKDVKDPIIKKQMLCSVGQARLFQVYADLLREQSVLPAQALISRTDFSNEVSFSNIKSTLEGLLSHGVLPIINENDVVSHEESSFGDNDQLAALTSIMLEADLLVILSDIDGFYTADPNSNPDATLIKEVVKVEEKLLAMCQDNLSKGGSGGMLSKLKAAELAMNYGIPAIVTSGTKEKSLIDAVSLKKGGTFFNPSSPKKPLSHKGNWVTSAAEIKGSITVDDGAQKALGLGKSLLAVGIIDLEGDFKEKQVVLVQNSEKVRLGAGMVNFDASEIKVWINSDPKPQNKVVIHTNHLYRL
ncbi:MAG: glutamate 5-kinase [SAR324 cluster bacterium]|nr:glutamate 5-kinase [SAR324 cluster bacterium]